MNTTTKNGHDLDTIITLGAERLEAALNHVPTAHEDAVRERLALQGIRIMKRRAYTEKNGDTYWVMSGTPLTLHQIDTKMLGER